MAQEKQLQNNNISQFNGGLHTDNSLVDSPKGTYRFALNSVNETELGDFGFISNEESNEQCASLTTGYIPIGKCYIGDNETVIFSVSADNSISEIGILDNNCNYTPVVNDGGLRFLLSCNNRLSLIDRLFQKNHIQLQKYTDC